MTKTELIQKAIDDFNALGKHEEAFGRSVRIRARWPVLATDCDYEIVSVSGVQGKRLSVEAGDADRG